MKTFRFAQYLLTAAGLSSTVVLAADLMPVNQLESRTTGGVSSASTLGASNAAVGMSFEQVQSLRIDREMHTADQRASALVSYGLLHNLDLGVGLHGTSDKTNAANRRQIFGRDDVPAVSSNAFSSASLMLKMQMVATRGFAWAVAPFVESGSGKAAQFALTRSESAKGGLMSTVSYGAARVGEVSLTGGGRFRQKEVVGEDTLGNEWFYQAAVRGYLSNELALFGVAKGRAVSAQIERDEQASNKMLHDLDLVAGVSVTIGSAEWSAYGGTHLVDNSSVTGGQTAFGAQLTYAIGHSARRDRPSFADDIKKSGRGSKADETVDEEPGSALSDGKLPPELSQDQEIDATQFLDANAVKESDFLQVEQELKKTQKERDAGIAEQVRMEREIEQIKAAEKKAEADRMQAEELEREMQRQEARRNSKANAKKQKAWDAEAEKAAKDLPTITHDEMNWNGLE